MKLKNFLIVVGAEGFYEKNGCRKGMQSYTIEKKRD